MVKSKFVQKSFLKNRKTQTQTQTLFSKPPEIKGFRPYTETQKSHRQGGQLFPLVCFRETHKIFYGLESINILEVECSILIKY